MNKLIWIDEKGINLEKSILSKLKIKNSIIDVCCLGDFNTKPVSFEGEEENFIINWSGEQNKIEFYISTKFLNSFCEYYYYTMYYSEWGDVWEKPIIFMQMKSENQKIKTKRPFKLKEIINFIKKNKKIKLSIYFETTIIKDPEIEDYKEENNTLMLNIAGIYQIIETGIKLENKKFLKIEKKEWKMGNKNTKIKNYCNLKEYISICKETEKTSKEMKINKINWKIFYKPTL